MTRLTRSLAGAAAAVLSLAGAARAADDSRLRLEVLVSGVPVSEYAARGTRYVEALRGHEYSLRVTNLEPVRVAVAVSVDGRNSIDAEHTSARDARKWILEPYQSITLDGWQTSGSTARRFFFTTEEKSYAAWLGDTSNAGVIEAIAFRERQPEPPVAWWGSREDDASSGMGDAPGGPAAERAAAPPSAPSMRSEAVGRSGSLSSSSAQRKAQSAAKDAEPEEDRDAAATGIGRTLGHEVVHVDFDGEDMASGHVRLRYEYHDALVRLGVLPPPPRPMPIHRREQASGFTDGPYCPQPRMR